MRASKCTLPGFLIYLAHLFTAKIMSVLVCER
jgi:hypothetical protein